MKMEHSTKKELIIIKCVINYKKLFSSLMAKLAIKICIASHKNVLQKKFVLDNSWMKIVKSNHLNIAAMVLHVLMINVLR